MSRLLGVRWLSSGIVSGRWRAQGRADGVAVRELFSKKRTLYSDLLRLSLSASKMIQEHVLSDVPAHVLLACRPSIEYCLARWAIWGASGTVVPVDPLLSTPQIKYFMRDSHAALVITDQEHICELAYSLDRPVLHPKHLLKHQRHIKEPSQQANDSDPAMIIYTAGTTGKPKGVMISHAALASRVASLTEAWEYSDEFNVLHCLPLHHIDGATNALDAVLSNGGTVSLLQEFDAKTTWQHICEDDSINVLTAMPNMYCKLIDVFNEMDKEQQHQYMKACRRFKLMVSGGSVMPASVLNRWKEISGHVLLERYGMSEVGMVLGNVLHGEHRAGYFGTAFPNVQLKIEPEEGHDVEGAVECGELRVKGPTLFSSYWNLDNATVAAFDEQGWFKTGDVAAKDASGDYRIIGKSSSDMLNTDGHSVSVMEIEQIIKKHPDIADCAVFGVPDEVRHNTIAVAVVTQRVNSTTTDCELELGLSSLREWLADSRSLPYYKLPRHMLMLDELPRDSTGKLRKESLVRCCLEQLK